MFRNNIGLGTKIITWFRQLDILSFLINKVKILCYLHTLSRVYAKLFIVPQLFALMLISRKTHGLFLTCRKNKVSPAPNTRNRNSAYSVNQSYKQYYEFVVSHSHVLEQLVSTAPREWGRLCLALQVLNTTSVSESLAVKSVKTILHLPYLRWISPSRFFFSVQEWSQSWLASYCPRTT